MIFGENSVDIFLAVFQKYLLRFLFDRKIANFSDIKWENTYLKLIWADLSAFRAVFSQKYVFSSCNTWDKKKFDKYVKLIKFWTVFQKYFLIFSSEKKIANFSTIKWQKPYLKLVSGKFRSFWGCFFGLSRVFGWAPLSVPQSQKSKHPIWDFSLFQK